MPRPNRFATPLPLESARPRTRRDRMLSMTEANPSLLKISDKLSVRFQKIGSGPPLLLIHTIRTQLEYFRTLAPLLATSHTVYAIDLPGHGRSPIDPSASFDEPYFRRAVIRFIEE